MGTFINITVIVIAVIAVGLMIWAKFKNKSCCGCSGNCQGCSGQCANKENKREDKNSE